jgi:C1A family cysteine protease
MDIYFIFTSVILFLFMLYYYYLNLSYDNYSKILPPLRIPDSNIYINFQTPLLPLTNPIKKYEKGQNLPKIYFYNPQFLSPVRNQRNCGACWAFVLSSMLSDDVTVRITNFGKSLSVQELLTCYPNTQGCEGAEPEAVLNWLEKSKFRISISDDYIPVDDSECRRFADVGIGIAPNSVKSLCKYVETESSVILLDNEIILNNIYNMKMQIRNNGPIYSTMSVYEDFFNFNGNGIYSKKSKSFLGGHAIEIIGWCDKGVDLRENYNDYGYWVCKNSWGIKWADKYDFPGYFAIRMGYNECGIESRTGCAEPFVNFELPNQEISENILIDSFDDLLFKIMNKRLIKKYNLLGLV